MANESDMTSMSESQMEALQQLVAVTQMDVDAARPLLERSQWNVQVSAPPSPGADLKLTGRSRPP